VEKELPAIIAGTLDNWRLEDEEDRCSIMEDETDSESAVCDSFRRWYLDSWAVVFLIAASRDALSLRLKLFRSFLASRSLRKSEMLSSSDLTSPELPPSPSLRTSDPRWSEDATLPLPLLRLSSSVLLPPLMENLLRR
jgi:hypothetical protein